MAERGKSRRLKVAIDVAPPCTAAASTWRSFGWHLIGQHNIYFYHRLMRNMRNAIIDGSFEDFYRQTKPVLEADDLEAQGSFMDMEYTFERGGRKVAEVSKRWFSWTDTYGVDIADGEDDVLILASTVVIDMICHADKQDD